MKLRSPRNFLIAGAALPELLIGTIAASIVLGGLMVGSIALQRSFSASESLARAQADLHRVADYVARDIRNATSLNTTTNGSVMLTVNTADYYNQSGTPNSPTIGRTSASYGTNPVAIRYLRSGTQILREVTRVSGGAGPTSTTRVADNVNTLTVAVDSEGIATITSTSAMKFGRRKEGAQAPPITFVMASQPRNPIP